MLQKDLLKQDMFLIGYVFVWCSLMRIISGLILMRPIVIFYGPHSPPGASRRLLSMRFCELLNKEVEYIAVSQDTTESDLKQVHIILLLILQRQFEEYG